MSDQRPTGAPVGACDDAYAAYPLASPPGVPRQTVESIRRKQSRDAASAMGRANASRARQESAHAAPVETDPVCTFEGVSAPARKRGRPAADSTRADGHADTLGAWFAQRGWAPAAFQEDVWARYLRGESGLLHTPTGSGKTLAAFGGPLIEAAAERAIRGAQRGDTGPCLKVMWITPLRALATDTVRALREPIEGLGLDWQVGLRTGDASARDRKLAREGGLDVLVTTPESLALLLSYPDTPSKFAALQCVVVDEWHELLGTKRGVLLQLCLARLRRLSPTLRTWGLSATLGNLDEARDVLLPHSPRSAMVSGATPRAMTLESLLPEEGERFPWAGHLGLSQLARVTSRLFDARTSLVFTNTRAHAELWHQALAAVWPEDPATLALHHGSLDPKIRANVEAGLRDGSLRCVVATSSLDLGVDFPAVDQVFQLGSPKGTARLLQRAGRAKHRPGESGHVVCVPTHMLELVEFAAVREAISRGVVEARTPPRVSLDVLAQHCVTLALGGGFDAAELLDEVHGTHAFAQLADEAWQSVLDFIVQGGRALEHYPDFRRVVKDEAGRYVVDDRRVATRHRLSIGTITSEGSVAVKYLRGASLGTVEEGFMARLRPGDRFLFAGRMLQLVRMEAMTAYVKRASAGEGQVPKWTGIRAPLSMELAAGVERLMSAPSDVPEMRAVMDLLALQSRLSSLPVPGRLLAELTMTRDGQQLYVFPFAGRLANEGLAALIALRWGRLQPNTFGYSANDYGLVLSPAEPVDVDAGLLHEFVSPDRLFEDLRESLNLGELARRQFREIARIAGLLPPSVPGRPQRSTRQLQASSGLLFDVLQRHDPQHMLLELAEREVFSGQLEVQRLQRVLDDCASRDVMLLRPRGLTPLSFPLWAEGLRSQLSTEDWKTRVQRAASQLERRHGR